LAIFLKSKLLVLENIHLSHLTTGYKITDKMKEFINATKIEEQIDTYDQKIYEFIEHLFSDHNSVQLVFVD
jgi:hypothetical protein